MATVPLIKLPMSIIQPVSPYPSLRGASKKLSGFTLIESLVVLVILIALAALAGPNFISILRNQRTASEINNLQNDLQFARSQALKEGQMVAVCASTNGTSCNGSSWHAGWIVYSAGLVPGFVAGTSIVQRVQPAFNSGDQVTTNPVNTTSVTFNRDGFSEGFAGTAGLLLTLRDSTANTAATRCIWIDVLGRSYVQKRGAQLTSNGQVTACT